MKRLLIILLLFICMNNVFAEELCFKGGEWIYKNGEEWGIQHIYGECDNPYSKEVVQPEQADCSKLAPYQQAIIDNIIGACVGGATSAATDIASQYVSGNDEINWGEVGAATALGATTGFLNPLTTLANTIKNIGTAIADAVIPALGGRAYNNSKNNNKLKNNNKK